MACVFIVLGGWVVFDVVLLRATYVRCFMYVDVDRSWRAKKEALTIFF